MYHFCLCRLQRRGGELVAKKPNRESEKEDGKNKELQMAGSETRFLQELVLYAASAALSCLVLFVGLRHLDPNREATKKVQEHKKEIAKRLGRPLIQTTAYEVSASSFVILLLFEYI